MTWVRRRAGRLEQIDGGEARPAGRDDVLDQQDAFTAVQDALDRPGRAVTLGRVDTDEDRGQSRREGDRRGQGHCAERGSRYPLRLRRDKLD